MKKHCGNCANYVWGDKKTPLPSECITCTTTHVPDGQHPTPSHWKAKPQTNADRIRAMSDEELADAWMKDVVVCHRCAYVEECERDEYVTIEKCKEGLLEWLKQPAEEAKPFHFEKGAQPHGAEQFAHACAVCVNSGSDLCRECKKEKKSGFEPPF